MNNQQFGLRNGDLENIIYILQIYPIATAIVFGSRAKSNTYKNGSDVDIAIKGDNFIDIR